VIKVDAAIPGCPIDRFEFLRIVQMVLQGRKPKLPEYPLCVECKLLENGCLNKLGKPCLGPITRAGCMAICPTYGDGCEACRGFAPEANFAYMREILRGHGLSDADIDARFTMFNHYQLQQMGDDAPLWTRITVPNAPLPKSSLAAPEEN
jgi:coenzyme F420-reducing hydrogenase gamma subunit